FSGNERNCVFLNRGNGKFTTVSALSGWDFPDDSRGLALMDWDHDGKIDFLTSNRNAPRVRMMRNQMKKTGNWIGFDLIGKGNENRDAIGARVRVVLKSGRVIIRTLRAGEGFASQSSKRLHMGLGSATEIAKLTVVWPNGDRMDVSPPEINGYYRIQQSDRSITAVKKPQLTPRKPAKQVSAPTESSNVRVPLQMQFPAPNLRYTSVSKQKLIQSSKLERPLLICLWSESCEQCRKKLKHLTAEAKTIGKQFDVLALCIDQDAGDRVKAQAFLREIQFPWSAGVPSGATNKALVAIFGHTLSTLHDLPTPSALLVSKNGNISTLYQKHHSVDTILADVKTKPESKRWLSAPDKINLLYLPRILMDHGTLEDTADYVSRAHNKLLDHKEYCVLLAWVAGEFLKRNQTQMAASYFQFARQAGQNNAVVMNNVAWVYATNKNAQLRNGKLAVICAMRAVQLTRSQNAGYLDTLAAAYAETGNFPLAIATANKAIKVAQQHRQHALIPSIKQSIGHYRRSQPIRE
ncbi:MAG: ASPIC/UnbV domain-containing protein, partial [Akkermansiaceae bacterium]